LEVVGRGRPLLGLTDGPTLRFQKRGQYPNPGVTSGLPRVAEGYRGADRSGSGSGGGCDTVATSRGGAEQARLKNYAVGLEISCPGGARPLGP
jgi:hypothetical protein